MPRLLFDKARPSTREIGNMSGAGIRIRFTIIFIRFPKVSCIMHGIKVLGRFGVGKGCPCRHPIRYLTRRETDLGTVISPGGGSFKNVGQLVSLMLQSKIRQECRISHGRVSWNPPIHLSHHAQSFGLFNDPVVLEFLQPIHLRGPYFGGKVKTWRVGGCIDIDTIGLGTIPIVHQVDTCFQARVIIPTAITKLEFGIIKIHLHVGDTRFQCDGDAQHFGQ
mmetsp:Transcript_1373/g.3023  ORF Transcript_1373/g.3023 Transcript_1373/m.3023 type:complete len:221 (+) Transcript_1373:1955-2617(+)